MKKVFTLAILYKNNKVLLGLKKTKMGAGWYNGFGGRVEIRCHWYWKRKNLPAMSFLMKKIRLSVFLLN